jgi:hypothetical protein
LPVPSKNYRPGIEHAAFSSALSSIQRRHGGCSRSPGTARCKHQVSARGEKKMLGTVLLVILILALLGSVPVYPYSAQWGYFPSGIIGTVLIVWLILVLIGRV